MSGTKHYVVDDSRLAVNLPDHLTWVNLDGLQVLFVPMAYVESDGKQLVLFGIPKTGYTYE